MKKLLAGLVIAAISVSAAANEESTLKEGQGQKCFAMEKQPQAGFEMMTNPVCDEAISRRIMAEVTIEMEERFAKVVQRHPPR